MKIATIEKITKILLALLFSIIYAGYNMGIKELIWWPFAGIIVIVFTASIYVSFFSKEKNGL